MLRSEFEDVEIAVAGNSEMALQQASADGPWSLIVTDLSLPGRDGPELVAELARLAPASRIVVYTMHPENRFGVRVLRAGAHGYITKDRPLEELADAFHRVLSGKRYISAELAEGLVDALSGDLDGAGARLSDRELQVLRLMGQGMAAQEIAERLHLSGKTVATYRRRLLDKLRLNSTADLIRYAIENEFR
jgi:DNA-binding NarL/FixJ family response regulator